ncbi:MAG TPA: monovalent cation/H(+) antiporter subunit G [Solirubrobacteraceae bacterium]|nr:monovalent cation/H(+) antiporter subunit G [Solirubrobacteraceae bacterium]
MSWRTIAATVLLIAGVGIELLAVLGLCALRDVYDRLHYVGLVGYGALLVSVAIVVHSSFSLIGDKALFIGVFFVVSGPVLAHVTIRSLLTRERGDWRAQIVDAADEEAS